MLKSRKMLSYIGKLYKLNENILKKANDKEHSNSNIALFHVLARWCSKSYNIGFNSTWTKNSQMFKMDLENTEEPEIKWPIFVGSYKKQVNSRKKKKASISASLTKLKPIIMC